MHDNEVVLHALYDLAQAAHDLLIYTTTPIPLALHAQLRHEHMQLLVLDHSRQCPQAFCCCKVWSGAKVYIERTRPHAWHCWHDNNSSSQLINAAIPSSQAEQQQNTVATHLLVLAARLANRKQAAGSGS